MSSKPRRFWSVLLVPFAPLLYSDTSNTTMPGPAVMQTRLKVRRRTAVATLGVLGVLLVVGFLATYDPLQFASFQGASSRSVSEGNFTYLVTIRNWGIFPVRVTGIDTAPGLPLSTIEVQARPDQRDPAGRFHPFTLAPFQERDLIVTSRINCGGRVTSERVHFSFLGIGRQSDVDLPETLHIDGTPC